MHGRYVNRATRALLQPSPIRTTANCNLIIPYSIARRGRIDELDRLFDMVGLPDRFPVRHAPTQEHIEPPACPLYPHMTVGDNMGFALQSAGHNKSEIARRVTDTAKILDLTVYLDRKPKALAGGRRRLATTTVYVTPDQVEAMTMGDRVALLKGGVQQPPARRHSTRSRSTASSPASSAPPKRTR